jgi:pimeloyl-ACP methyl ester carboxylesterase
LANELRKALNLGLRAADLTTIENGLFLEAPSEDIRRQLFHRMDDIAETASRQLLGWTPFAPLPWAMPKLLVMGGEHDQFVPAGDVRLTAIYYGERSHIVRNGAHAIMMDRNWRDAAEPISEWLTKAFKSS